MLPIPTNIPTQNNHRVALYLPDQSQSDFDRLEDMTADGLAAARRALCAMKHWQNPTNRALLAEVAELTNSVAKRRLLNDRFCDAASAVIAHMSHGCFEAEPGADAGQITHDLNQALHLSNRVRDLLAAERDVGWHRGMRD
ncbi:hypothetical protein [Shimia sagamensis]|uniref:Uncharacterized protein n=1 Tax=Shimia sagamensis TaxID=1566352 RepID=A0ABY1PM61_9RHOB|nr:hypothetical protein [Shimia sagamensis]SMP37186.1 hypothetical protein SAMN06265373_1283 [Shimia sagamensis]